MEAPQEPLNMTSNVAFRAFFKGNDELLISILEDFLPLPKGYDIESVSLMDGEETPEQLRPEGKTYRLDLKVKLFKKGFHEGQEYGRGVKEKRQRYGTSD